MQQAVLLGIAATVMRRRLPWLSTAAARVPYFSGMMFMLFGLYVCYNGITGLRAETKAAGQTGLITIDVRS